MDAESAWRGAVSLLLLVGNAFFVMAEYGLVSCRKAHLESLARRGNRAAKSVVDALNNVSFFVAGTQVAITLFSIGIGSITEPWVTSFLESLLGISVSRWVSTALSLVLVTYFTVVLGELVPKYVSLNSANRVAMATIFPLRALVTMLKPLIWVIQKSGAGLLMPFGINVAKLGTETLPREELLLLVRSGTNEGLLEKVHGEILSRAVTIDKLVARDIMVHRLDVHWLDIDTPTEQLLEKLSEIPHSRIPICRGDIDDVVGVVYLHHVVKGLAKPGFRLADAVLTAEAVPENLGIDRIIVRMRESRRQILIVMDEYGGTSGIITLEDVVEEIFGDLEDRLESERPPIDILPNGRISARSDVRFDELVGRLGIEMEDVSTDTLATIIINELERVPKMGDKVETQLGVLRVENMARSRITRVGLQLTKEHAESLAAHDSANNPS